MSKVGTLKGACTVFAHNLAVLSALLLTKSNVLSGIVTKTLFPVQNGEMSFQVLLLLGNLLGLSSWNSL